MTFADREGQPQDLEDKKGKSPDRFISVRGFFVPDPETHFKLQKRRQ